MTLETKSMKLSLNPGQTVTILTWYDTVSEESASNGAYDSTGNDMHRCFCSNLVEAAIEIASWTLNNAYDYGDILDDTLTSIDADTDLDSGDSDYNSICILADPVLSIAQRNAFSHYLNTRTNAL